MYKVKHSPQKIREVLKFERTTVTKLNFFSSTGALSLLEQEIQPDPAFIVGSSAAYHKNLALTLFYKVEPSNT